MADAAITEELRLIAPNICIACGKKMDHTDGCRLNQNPIRLLVIDPPLKEGMEGWGHIGNRIISYAIIELWKLNRLIEPVSSDNASNVWVLSERGQLAADHKIKDDEIVRPKSMLRFGQEQSDEIPDAPVEGLLFTPAGTCTLCGKKMEAFGMVSHAKAHIGKGHPVFIEEVNRKKVLRVKPGANLEPLLPPPVRIDNPGEFSGSELFSSTSRCRLCPEAPPVHKFGQISHAKSHINKGDPVEIRMIGKKNVPVVTGEIVMPTLEYKPSQEMPGADLDLDEDMTMQDRVREEGIAALLTLQRSAGLTEDREAAAKGWDQMGPVSRFQTLKTAEALED